MPSVADLVEPHLLLNLATHATLRLGREIAAADAVEFMDFTPLLVRGRVGGPRTTSQRRTTELRSDNRVLRWSCSCSRKGMFCKHCVALAIAISDKAPKLRGRTESALVDRVVVPGGGIEPPTRGFSIRCSTN